MKNKHDEKEDTKSRFQGRIAEEEIEEKENKKKEDQKVEQKIEADKNLKDTKNKSKDEVLVYLRDNVVHGNEKHVEKINSVL